MKRTVIHASKQLLKNPFDQADSYFPFLGSNIVQSYSKSIIKFKRIHAVCNYKNIESVVPLPSPCIQFIFFGRSNVGKSSLMNKLLQCDVAEISKRPGKTKQLLFCQVGPDNISDKKMIQSNIYFIDAPGYGYATGVSKSEINQWGKLIKTYLSKTKSMEMSQKIICLIDITHELKQTDALMLQLLKSMNKRFQLVFTKCDKFQTSIQNQNVKKGIQIAKMIQEQYQTMNFYVHFTSCKTGMGIDQLRNHILFNVVESKL